MMPLTLMIGESFGIECDEAINGEVAVKKFKDDFFKECCDINYKLILMDIQMPIMNGFDASREILKLLAFYNKID